MTDQHQEATPLAVEARDPACWLAIGVWGRQEPRCPELPRVVHCRNCEIYQQAGRALLDLVPPEGYGAEWARAVADRQASAPATRETVLVIRLKDERFALPLDAVREVVEWRTIRSMPNSHEAVLGLVNIRGNLQICVALEVLFEGERPSPTGRAPRARLLRVGDGAGEWVIAVDEVLGLPEVDPTAVRDVPVTVFKSSSAYVRGLFEYLGHPVGWLDVDLLLAMLRRRLT